MRNNKRRDCQFMYMGDASENLKAFIETLRLSVKNN